MDHTQFEMLVAAVLTSGIAAKQEVTEPKALVGLMLEIRDALVEREAITKQSAAFVPKGR
jgi:hypothetical protein